MHRKTLELARSHDADERAHKRCKLAIKERQLLLKEFENNLIDRNEYHERSKALMRNIDGVNPSTE